MHFTIRSNRNKENWMKVTCLWDLTTGERWSLRSGLWRRRRISKKPRSTLSKDAKKWILWLSKFQRTRTEWKMLWVWQKLTPRKAESHCPLMLTLWNSSEIIALIRKIVYQDVTIVEAKGHPQIFLFLLEKQ